jgi:hypothetical protein
MLERNVRGESANTWKLAEEAYTPGTPGDALRYMDNPHLASNKGFTADDDPDHYSERYTGASDNGGVHINSGISNKAFYLLAQGGTHHLGGSMTGIGADAAAQIWFTALSSYMTSGTNFINARLATSLAAAALYGSGSTRHQAVEKAWCLVGVGPCLEAISVSPNAGTGITQTFTLAYSDSAGVATDLSGASVRFTNNADPTKVCRIQHRVAGVGAGMVRMADDVGTWGPFTAYGSGVLENTQCRLNLGSSSATPSGNNLTVVLNITFKPAFAGAATVTMRAQSLSGADSGWLPRGSWTVGGVTVNAVSITPNSGSGITQTFTAVYTDSLGVTTDLLRARVRFGASGVGACVIDYDAIANKIRMLDDAGGAGVFTSLGMGTLSNSQCTLDLATSTAVPSGTTLTLNLRITFKPPFAGPQPISVRATSSYAVDTGWVSKGTFTVGAVVDAVSITPNSGKGLSQTFTAVFTDSLGVATDLLRARVRFGTSGVGACLIDYDAIANQVRLADDAGTPGPFFPLGTGTALANSQCALDLAQSSAVRSGDTLTLNLQFSFDPTFLGPKPVFLRANSNFGNTTGWVQRGTWDVNVDVQAISVLPNNSVAAAGAPQTFLLQFFDSGGVANDLVAARVRFRAPSGVQCNISYNAILGQVRIVKDDGTFGPFVSFGTGTIENSQCTLDLSMSGAAENGTDLSIFLNIAFKPAFANAMVPKNIDMRANSNTGATTDWLFRGLLTVTP